MTTVDRRVASFVDAGISEVRPGRWWHLTTSRTSYVVGFDDDDYLVSHYWGERLPAAAALEVTHLQRGRWNSSFERPSELDEQLPVDGGHRWSVPSLQVRFAGGVRALDLSAAGATIGRDASGDTLCIALTDSAHALRVELWYRTRTATDVIERWVEITNHHAVDTVEVLRADSGNWVLPDLADYRISTAQGYWAAETQLARDRLPHGEFTLTSRQGTTGHVASPWMMIDDSTATEVAGEVWSVALGWSGSWRLTAQRRPEGPVSITGGFGHDGLSWPLGPGDVLRTPPLYGLRDDAGFGAVSQAWHHFVRRHLLPHPDENRPVLYNSWEATGFDVDEAAQMDLARVAAGMGVELFVMDDGWFGNRRNDRAGLGDWHPSPDLFPDGLGRVVETVHGLGMGFGLWVEPEMVNTDSDLYRLHPEWVLHWPTRPRTERRNQLVLNFARDDVRAWALEWLDRLVGEYGVDFLKWDMNRPFTEAGWPERPDRADLLWVEHTRGVYTVIDEVRRRHPELRIEACASGGARADLGIVTRTDQVWISDNTDALDRQRIQDGFSQILPAVTMGAWVTDEVNAMTGRSIPLDYRFHVAMAGVLGIGADLTRWSSAERARAAAHVARYKQIRPVVQRGRQYRLGGSPGQSASAVQYVADDDVVVLMYEAHRSLSSAPRRLRLRGLDRHARYRDTVTGTDYSGALLMAHGLRFVPAATDRGWNNTRFSTADYISNLTTLKRVVERNGRHGLGRAPHDAAVRPVDRRHPRTGTR